MPVVLTCPNGHRWEVAHEAAASRAEADMVCPFCGTMCDDPDAAPSTDSGTDDLPAPPASGPTVLDRGQRLNPPGHETPPRLPGYEMLGMVGQGGMGVVYKARELGKDRVVAVKVVRKDRLVHAESVRRFRREAQAAARLTHPNVVRVHDSDTTGDTHYLVMEFVDGITLQKMLEERGPLPVAQACDYMRQAALGLQHAHEMGLVHRDVKPANLMVTRAQGLQSGGFDVLKVLDLGVAKLYQLRDSPVESLTTLTQDGAVIGTADFIAPEQLESPSDADIRADLYSLGCTFYALLTGQVPFPGGTLIQKLDWQRFKTPPAVDQLRGDVPRAVVDVVRRLMAKKPADRYKTPGDLAEALAKVAGGDAGKVAAACREARSLTGHAGAIWGVAISPDGATIASGGKDRSVRLWRLDGAGEMRAIAIHPQEVRCIAFTSAGRLLTASGAGLRLLDAHSGEELLRFTGHTDTVRALAVSADGERAVSGGDDRAARVWDVQTGRELLRFARHSAPVTGVAISPSGDLVLSASRDQTMRLWNIRNGGEVTSFPVPRGQVLCVAFSPDGAQALSGHFDTMARLWEIAGARELRRLTGHRQMVTAAAFLPCGRRALTAAQDQTLRLWDLESGCELCRFEGHAGGVTALAVAPGGKAAVSGGADGTIRVWDIPE